ncbi:MAG: MFS transporter [Myxococcota bacterium]|nr:MFS transporter [Myxococcota bacterium]
MSKETKKNPISYRELINTYPHFTRVWLSEFISFVGDWFNTVAIYTAVQELSNSAQAIALVMVVKMLPGFLVAPMAGPLIDRYDRRKILLILDVVRLLTALALIPAYHFESLAGLYILSFIMMGCEGVAAPAKSTIVPMVVPKHHLATANALGGGTWSICLAIGAALGGLVTQKLGISAAFFCDALTFLWAFALLWPLPAMPPKKQESSKQTMREGLVYLWARKYLLILASLKPMIGLLGGAFVLIPIYGTDIFPKYSGPLFVGLLYAHRGLGAVVGAMVIRIFVGDKLSTLRRMIIVGFTCSALAYIFLGYSSTFWQALLAFFLGALGTSMVWVFSNTLLHNECDAQYHGRVFSYEFGGITLFISIFSWLSGYLMDSGYSASFIAHLTGYLAIIPIVLWLVALFLRAQKNRYKFDHRLELRSLILGRKASVQTKSNTDPKNDAHQS